MQTVEGAKLLPKPLAKSVVTIGNFDGLHLGHRKIISRVKELALQTGGASVVVTFDPHPRQVLAPNAHFRRLFSRDDLRYELEVMGIDYLILEPFSRDLSQLSPETYFSKFIVQPFNPSALVVGYDFSFGANRAGNLEVVKNLADKFHAKLEIVPAQSTNGEVISSSRIRKSIEDGDVVLAREMLGRNFYLEGLVERGEGRGAGIGIPTANISSHGISIPKIGVYAGWLTFDGKRHPAVTNIGVNPTFHSSVDAPLKVEAHVLEKCDNLYGKHVKFEFVARIRDEKKFAGVDALKKQIADDIRETQRLLATGGRS